MSSQKFPATPFDQAVIEFSLDSASPLLVEVGGQSNKQSCLDRLRIDDTVVRIHALTTLLALGERINESVLAVALKLAPLSAHLRRLLVRELLQDFRFDLADEIIALEQAEAGKSQQRLTQLMRAQASNDYVSQCELYHQLYLQTGDLGYIAAACNLALERLHWQAALKPVMRMMFVRTAGLEETLVQALEMLGRADAKSEFALLARAISKLDGYLFVRAYAMAQLLFWKEDYRGCLGFLNGSNALSASENSSPILPNLAAKCAEALADYRQAALWYEQQNGAQKDVMLEPARFIDDLEKRATLGISLLRPDPRTTYFVMTGFPRSGTTLLENALNAHPLIATCEETSSLIGTFSTAYGLPTESLVASASLDQRAGAHRDLYYRNLDRYVGKPAATVVIDKTPIISANIKYMEKLFPNKRYVFSIRHPYDVVLSNWKQVYGQNIAMAAFNNIHDACVLYDHVMTDWFEVFPGATDRVYYVRYEELVSDFRRVVDGALGFLGVAWTDEVLKFAEHAAKRSVRTPSYAKVRQGLTIGVQTSWKNFEFLFDEKCRALLDPWSKRFGYSD